jgi:microcystin-dependent protein
MRTFLLIAALVMVRSAHADISDSGNLSIGQNGVFIGSVTAGAISGSSITATEFYGDGSHLTGLFNLPVGTILPYASSTVPSGYFECNGAAYGTVTYPVLYSSIGCTWGCSGSNFNIPDLRGVFMRGWNHGNSAGTYSGDPDAASRAALATGGATGDAAGSYEADAFKSHTHTYGATTSGSGGQSGSVYSLNVVTNTSATGGNETRPKNAYVMYIIKYDSGASTAATSGYVSKSGDTMTGALHMTNAPIILTSTGGYISSTSSVTASAFFGDGSHLTGIGGSLPFFYVINSTDATTTWALLVDDDGTLRTSSMTFAPASASSLPIESPAGGSGMITIDDDGTLRTNL